MGICKQRGRSHEQWSSSIIDRAKLDLILYVLCLLVARNISKRLKECIHRERKDPNQKV